MTPAELSDLVRDAVAAAVSAGDLAVELPEHVKVERPKVRDHGDYATNVALVLAKQAGRPSRDVAELVAGRLRRTAGIARVDVAGPGFLNLVLDSAAHGELARVVVESGDAYGRTDVLRGERINLEFVSANPTGPVHIGAVRWAAVGDALARILEATGASVTREYYFNDAGAQIDRFARSLLAAAQGRPGPDDGYNGAYIGDIAQSVLDRRPDVLELPEAEAQEVFRVEGVDLMFDEIKGSLAEFGVVFDVYFNEKDLHDSGEIDEALKRLLDAGNVYEKDGASWLRTTDFGDDKDRVLVKADGDWTYFAADAAYYYDKRKRGFDRVVIMLGADHHGYIGRYKALVAAYGDDPEKNLEILIGQMVNLVKDGVPVRMSKRAGNVLTLVDLVDAVGADAARYALARSSADSPIDLDLDLLVRHSNDNPVYYVQYAHARTCNVTKNAADVGIALDAFDPSLLSHETEALLLAALGEFPAVVATAAELREPHRVARYLEQLAGTYHRWYDACRVIPKGDEPVTDLNRTRAWLNAATRQVLANGLRLLGVNAPERM